MSAPCSPPWTRGSATRRTGYVNPGPRPSDVNPGLRLSDAERAEVADRLSKHYADGRLDEAEFNERLDRAMKAKTHADLNGLFADLPPGAEASQPPTVQRHRPPRHRGRLRHPILLLILVIAITASVGHALAHSFIPWLLIGLLAFIWLRRGPSRQDRF